MEDTKKHYCVMRLDTMTEHDFFTALLSAFPDAGNDIQNLFFDFEWSEDHVYCLLVRCRNSKTYMQLNAWNLRLHLINPSTVEAGDCFNKWMRNEEINSLTYQRMFRLCPIDMWNAFVADFVAKNGPAVVEKTVLADHEYAVVMQRIGRDNMTVQPIIELKFGGNFASFTVLGGCAHYAILSMLGGAHYELCISTRSSYWNNIPLPADRVAVLKNAVMAPLVQKVCEASSTLSIANDF